MDHASRSDEGLSLVETVVAMMVFVVFSVVSLSYLLNSLQIGKSNTQRVTAANLAAQQIETVRGSPVLSLPDGTTALPPKAVGGTTYQLAQKVAYVAGPGGQSVCDGPADTLAYKLVSLTVTWPSMGRVKPVRSDTLKTIGIGAGGAEVKKGAAAVAVRNEAGLPVGGVLVQLSPTGASGTTGSDGCVVFPNLEPTVSHTAKLTAPGHVGKQGESTATSTFSVVAGKVVKPVVSYAPRGAMQVVLTAPTGYEPPPTLGVVVDNADLTPVRRQPFADCSTVSASPQKCVSGSPRLASALFPGVYETWAGTCADARPTAPPSRTVVSGGVAAFTSSLGALRLTLSPSSAAVLGTRKVYAEHAADPASCTAGEKWLLQTLSTTDRRLALPAGSWFLVAYNDDDTTEYTRGGPFNVAAGAVVTVPA